jgi:hypothetical protein
MKKTARKQSGKQDARSLLASTRKPAASLGHPLARAKPEDRAHPAERKAKHKRRPGEGE